MYVLNENKGAADLWLCFRISTAQLICGFVFAYVKSRFNYIAERIDRFSLAKSLRVTGL